MDVGPQPLVWLRDSCIQCLRSTAQAECEACRELAYRAFCEGNDAAWDMLVVALWPLILRRLYVHNPELTPAAAEALGYRLLWRFRRHYVNRPNLTANFPTFPELLQTLYHYFSQIDPPHSDER